MVCPWNESVIPLLTTSGKLQNLFDAHTQHHTPHQQPSPTDYSPSYATFLSI